MDLFRRKVDHMTFDEKSENGLLMCDRYIPEELLTAVLKYVDYKSLLNCQAVCKRWRLLIRGYVWRKKAEMTLTEDTLPSDLPWAVYYIICKKRPFERNLIKNSCGEQGVYTSWRVLKEGGDKWTVESPPVGVPPLPAKEPVFKGKRSCFATSYHECVKEQIIDLEEEGLVPYILDTLQPPIVVSEWYSSRWDCSSKYECVFKLLSNNGRVLDYFQYHFVINGEDKNKWHYISNEFQKYGPGLRKISFCHGGIDRSYWAGHYGSKMAGASVYAKIPKSDCDEDHDEIDPLLDIY